MREIQELMERQARQQKSRKDLPWEEKIRMMGRVRADFERWLIAMRKDRAKASGPPTHDS